MRVFGYKLSHIFNLLRIKMFVRDKKGEVISSISGVKPSEAIAFSEMVLHRSYMCPQCTEAGKCIGDDEREGCLCPTPGLYAAPEASCELGYWNGYQSKDWVCEWEKDKKKLDLKVEVK